ncbi:MAG: 3-phosphoglycerate dehydrogenase [Clostridiales bacterium]|jgi:D-3-phosphoglycerate dehydrogenase|nr:3-phosphoglycerate dehydrogenase [Clostridiales bacterium]
MYNILTLNNISAAGTSCLPAEGYALSDKAAQPDAIMLRSFDMHSMQIPESALCVARAGAGVNNIPVDKCAEAGVVVFNTPGANANAVKELVITGLLISSRKIISGVNWAKSLVGREGVPAAVEKGKAAYAGPEIAGKTLGIIGLGAIGVLAANAAHALGMEVIGFDPFLSVDAAWRLSKEVRKAASLDEIYQKSDYISVHVPLSKDTKGMFGSAAFAKVKNGLRLLNFSRGELVDDAALAEALKAGRVAAYVTDFPNEATVAMDGVIPVPHLGASTPESEDNCAAMAATQLREYLEYGNIKNSVNFPDCELPWSGKKRFCVLHRNVPNVVGSVTAALGGSGFNIDNMVNHSKGAFACTLIDVDEDRDAAEAAAQIGRADGVIRVRVI